MFAGIEVHIEKTAIINGKEQHFDNYSKDEISYDGNPDMFCIGKGVRSQIADINYDDGEEYYFFVNTRPIGYIHGKAEYRAEKIDPRRNVPTGMSASYHHLMGTWRKKQTRTFC